MEIEWDRLIIFIIVWGVPLTAMTRAYFKMSTEDKESAMGDFKSRYFLCTLGAMWVGASTAHFAFIIDMRPLETTGLGLLLFGAIYSSVSMWPQNKARSIIIFLVVSIGVFMQQH